MISQDQIQRELPVLLAAAPPFAGRPGPITITAATRVSDGWETDVWSFGAQDATGQRQALILRLYQGHGAAAKAALEFRTLQRLSASGYPVPAVYLLEESAHPLGQPFIIMERIAGPALGRAFDDAGEAGKAELATLFVRLLADLHQLDWRPFVENPAQWEAADSGTQLRRTVDEFRRWLAGFGFAAESAPLLDWLDAHSHTVTSARPAVHHGDYHSQNILLRADGSPAVIDWSFAAVADPRFDLAWMLLLLDRNPTDPFPGQLVAAYEQMTGTPVRDLAYFAAWAVGRRLVIMLIVLIHGGERIGLRPGLEESLRQYQLQHLRMLARRLHELTGIRLPAAEPFL